MMTRSAIGDGVVRQIKTANYYGNNVMDRETIL
jgi:hypothetical protein